MANRRNDRERPRLAVDRGITNPSTSATTVHGLPNIGATAQSSP
jgi:hypothetical protein